MAQPRLTDIHAHGAAGHEFGLTLDGTLEAVAGHRRAGTRGVVASLVSAPIADLVDRLAVLREAMQHDDALLGAHLEGPFLAPSRRGAHPLGALIEPSPDAVDRLIEAGAGILRQVTIAPELPGALDAVERFAAAGVVVAVGHTDASALEARDAFAAGARLVTHAFNAMPPIAGRAPGPLAAAIADERVFLEVIADGVHVADDSLRLLFAAAQGRVVLVSDAIAAAGVGDGRYSLGRDDIVVTDGVATVAGTRTLAGSTMTLGDTVHRAVRAGIPEDDALEAASRTPRAVLDLARD